MPCAFHLGTIDEPREGRAIGAEPEDDVGGHILKREGPAGATEDPAQGRKGPRPC